jgi:hypothetical protein
MAVSGLSVAYITTGLVLVWSGYKNATVSDTLKGFLSGKVPAGSPTGAPTIGLSNSGSSSSSAANVPASGQGTISFTAAESYWTLAGGPANEASTAAAIAEAESTLNAKAVQQGQPYSSTGWGLWQITPGNSVPSVGTDSQLLNPLTNAKAAVVKYKAAGNSFSPWTTFTSGAYLKYLPTGSKGQING